MNESISEIQRLLQEIADHMKSGMKTDTRKAVAKLQRILQADGHFQIGVRYRQSPGDWLHDLLPGIPSS